MVIFSWEPKMALGVPLIDKQHQELIKAANSFFISCKCHTASKQTQECLDFLTQYILYHFQAEESFMVASNYPDYHLHQAAHNYLSMQLKLHQTNLISSAFSQEELDAFYTFLQEWVLQHIFNEDKEFIHYFNCNRA